MIYGRDLVLFELRSEENGGGKGLGPAGPVLRERGVREMREM